LLLSRIAGRSFQHQHRCRNLVAAMTGFKLALVAACALPVSLAAQINISVDASSVTGTIVPLWGDHYDVQLLFGAGGNPSVSGPHAQYIDDPAFGSEMTRLKPRFVRVSTARFDDPHSADSYSTDTTVLKDLWTEFYRGPNTMAGANDPDQYDFSYVDSLIDVVHAMGAEPFLDMASMPFTLASVDTPAYFPCLYWDPPCHLLGWDNGIRQAPPVDPLVYGRVFYQLVKHLYTTRGVTWFEVWNEPDQFPGFTPFWDGTPAELENMMSALADEVEADPDLSPYVKLGCCSFAMQSFLNLFAIQFLSMARDSSTRMDFISVHPYANGSGGYDSTKAAMAKGWRDEFFPNADLINAEWGILDPAFGSAGWNSLDYGLDRIKAIIDMNDRGYVMAHAASMTDNDTTSATCCLGMFYSKPTFAPKPAAFAYMAMNRLLGSTDRLACSVDTPYMALAARTPDADTVYIVLPAPDPSPNNGTISINVNNLPWGTGTATRHELTMSTYLANVVLAPAATVPINNGTFAETMSYASDDGNGRLVLWELVQNDGASIHEQARNAPHFVPNPGRDGFRISLADGLLPVLVRMWDAQGALARTVQSGGWVDTGGLASGLYHVEAVDHAGRTVQGRWVKE